MDEILTKLAKITEMKADIVMQESLLYSQIAELLKAYAQPQKKPDKVESRAKPFAAQYLNTKQAAEYLGLKYGGLTSWRFQGIGPRYIKMGSAVRYNVKDLDDFALKNNHQK